MSAWDCPGAFGILPYVEHAYGIYHVTGGLSEISQGMAKVCEEHGVDIRLSSPVKELTLDGRNVTGVELEDGEKGLHPSSRVERAAAVARKDLFGRNGLSCRSVSALG